MQRPFAFSALLPGVLAEPLVGLDGYAWPGSPNTLTQTRLSSRYITVDCPEAGPPIPFQGPHANPTPRLQPSRNTSYRFGSPIRMEE